ncbi:MAG: HAD family hydrolase [Treponema sp.]|nr:HAD family hydrolase [Spirochaetia bacterium]MDD7459688.1 HAD family hydrolase [Spirochaetales bacterium]MDY5811680.1 HAD family hydrolase [Treponema sp.]MEE1181370.1 HAD family hydrolase [Treponema sp.]
MFKDIQAVAFDIDGTLYPSWKLFIRMPFHVIKNFKLYVHFNKTRHVMHKTAPLADFYEYQARILAEISKLKSPRAKEIINEICYDGLKKFFKKVKPYPYVYECIKSMKDAGLKIGILSDFPPEQKGDIWGIRALCDVCIGSEESGALKPSVYPFGILAQELDVPADRILYVGNSLKYDVLGAKGAGMKTAYILKGFKKLFNIKQPEADISFRNYRQLQKIVLE